MSTPNADTKECRRNDGNIFGKRNVFKVVLFRNVCSVMRKTEYNGKQISKNTPLCKLEELHTDDIKREIQKEMKLNDEFIKKAVQWIHENGLQDIGGATVVDYCKAMGIDKKSHYNWLKDNSTYSTAIESAKEHYRSTLETDIVKSLAKLAKGYSYEKVKTEYGNDKNGRPKILKQTKEKVEVLPSVGAGVFLLTNLNPDVWKNKLQTDSSIKANVNAEQSHNYNFDDVPDELLYALADHMQNAEQKRKKKEKEGEKKQE